MNSNIKIILTFAGLALASLSFAVGYGAKDEKINNLVITSTRHETWIRGIEKKQTENYIEILKSLGDIKDRLPKK